MVCYKPLKGFIIGKKPDGKNILKVRPYEQECVQIGTKSITEYIEIPCGKCIGCNIAKSRDWSNRMMLELKDHDKASFITLTYNDENLPKSSYVDENGELKTSFTLCKRDFQLFMKRLRKHYKDNKVRFFACGEYGTKSKRPHYHAVLYGIDFSEDRYVFAKTDEGYVSWRSPTLEKLWPFGYTMINEVNWNTCAYVARYVTKKFYGSHKIYYQTFNIEPEFNLMSRRPGIGHNYYENHKDEIYQNQEIFLENNKGGLKVKPPKYFDRLYKEEFPAEMELIKAKRQELSIRSKELMLCNTNMTYMELLKAREIDFKKRIESLRRDKI